MELGKGWLYKQTVFLYSISPSASEIHEKSPACRIYRHLFHQVGQLPGSRGAKWPDALIQAALAEQSGLAQAAH
ncbi:hypothetical protein [Massilia psychrophila]|uniref:hypothetical protein n=1 Tax=Massilia psychrophila TaxID=1603353 RepID=UPI00117CEE71|nr:hypothetical protein [Massilia psychrophila]